MNKFGLLLLLLVLFGCESCTDFWSESNKRRFREACTEEALNWGSEAIASEYCECVLSKMMEKYPNEEDAFMHIDQLATDTGLINCKQEVMGRASK